MCSLHTVPTTAMCVSALLLLSQLLLKEKTKPNQSIVSPVEVPLLIHAPPTHSLLEENPYLESGETWT